MATVHIQINTSPAADVFNMKALSCGSSFVLYLAEGVLPFSIFSILTSVLLNSNK